METIVNLQPNFLENLFAFKKQIRPVFKEVLGYFDIDHLAVYFIDSKNTLSCFSATPAIEFNLFKGQLWHYDNTFKFSWLKAGIASTWQSLYDKARYDEVYYIKQAKPKYPTTISIPVKCKDDFMLIFSFASKSDLERTRIFFAKEHHNFYKIGMYCAKRLTKFCETKFNPSNEQGAI